MTEGFTVKAGQFEGPLDLLLNLIEKRKLHISEVSLAQVTDDYIQHIETFDKVSTASIAQFILTASTLVLIKSKALLPKVSITQEENESMEELELRLKLLQLFRTLGNTHIGPRFGSALLYAKKKRSQHIDVVFSPPKKTIISTESLLEAMSSVIAALPKQEHIPQTTVRKIISLEETIGNLLNRVQQGLKMGFKEYAGVNKNNKKIPIEKRPTIIVTFLAVLELARRGALQVSQQEQFGDISLETLTVDTPRYV